MGYRSEVAISLRHKDYNNLIENVKNNIDGYGVIKDLLHYADKITNIPDDDIIIIRWNWIKWYEEYKDIQKLNTFLHQEDDNGNILIPHCFTRIGEEYGDIETYQHIDTEEDWALDCIEPMTYINDPEGEDVILDLLNENEN